MSVSTTNSAATALEQIRRARDRLADLETRAIALGEYDHAATLHRAGAALDKVLDAAKSLPPDDL